MNQNFYQSAVHLLDVLFIEQLYADVVRYRKVLM